MSGAGAWEGYTGCEDVWVGQVSTLSFGDVCYMGTKGEKGGVVVGSTESWSRIEIVHVRLIEVCLGWIDWILITG